jgi:pimeloyl-ACP methyl ester carboxylesterase
MCVAPEKIKKAVLLVPAGIANVSTFNLLVKMGIPMLFYILTKKKYWMKKAILPMAIDEENISEETYEMVKASFEHINVKAEMPSNVDMELLKKCNAPTLLMPAEKDCMFPGKNILKIVEKTPHNFKIHMLKNQGHMFKLSADEMNMIKEFIDEEI